MLKEEKRGEEEATARRIEKWRPSRLSSSTTSYPNCIYSILTWLLSSLSNPDGALRRSDLTAPAPPHLSACPIRYRADEAGGPVDGGDLVAVRSLILLALRDSSALGNSRNSRDGRA
jgi:hypothetical protein